MLDDVFHDGWGKDQRNLFERLNGLQREDRAWQADHLNPNSPAATPYMAVGGMGAPGGGLLQQQGQGIGSMQATQLGGLPDYGGMQQGRTLANQQMTLEDYQRMLRRFG